MSTEQIEPTPPKTWKRNSETGLVEGIEYKYSSDGKIDWRAMVPKEYIVVNKQNFKNKKIPDSIEGVEDKDLLIKLGGFKYLAALRGFKSIVPTVTHCSPHFVGFTTKIVWIPNVEENYEITSTGSADATPSNTTGFSSLYLTATAENRAYSRAVRIFLGINVVSQDEVGPSLEESVKTVSSTEFGPHTLLAKTLEKGNISFDVFHNRMMVLEKDGKDFAKGASEWTKLEDVNESVVFSIVAFINEGLEKKKKKEAKG